MQSLKVYFRTLKERIAIKLKRLSFKTGLLILSLCVPFYIISFLQMSLDISYTLKGVLWIILFGIAKTLQYTGLLIIGVEGIKKLKLFFVRRVSD